MSFAHSPQHPDDPATVGDLGDEPELPLRVLGLARALAAPPPPPPVAPERMRTGRVLGHGRTESGAGHGRTGSLGGSDQLLTFAGHRARMFGKLWEDAVMLSENACKLWRDVEVRLVWCDRSVWEVVHAAWWVEAQVAEARAKGRQMKNVTTLRIRGANHFVSLRYTILLELTEQDSGKSNKIADQDPFSLVLSDLHDSREVSEEALKVLMPLSQDPLSGE